MGKLLGMLGSLLALLCTATVISILILGIYFWNKGYLAPERVAQMIAAAQGITPEAKAASETPPAPSGPQKSFEEQQRLRSVMERNLEIREQSLDNRVEWVRFEQQRLAEQKQELDRIQSDLAKKLEEMKAKNIQQGEEQVRSIWENIEPDQAKQQIMLMLEQGELNQVVSLLNAMPIGKKADIVAEFRSDDELKKVDQLLRLMRRGEPGATPIDQAREKLDQFDSQASGSQPEVQ